MKIFFITILVTVAVDQASKYFIKMNMMLHQSVQIIENFFYITYIENSGIAFGMFGHNDDDFRRWMLVGIITAAMIVIAVYWRIYRNRSFVYNFSCGLILGGALGNYIDRLLRGSVTDFLEFGIYEYRFAIFNAADAAVSVGVVLFVIYVLFMSDKYEKQSKTESKADAAAESGIQSRTAEVSLGEKEGGGNVS